MQKLFNLNKFKNSNNFIHPQKQGKMSHTLRHSGGRRLRAVSVLFLVVAILTIPPLPETHSSHTAAVCKSNYSKFSRLNFLLSHTVNRRLDDPSFEPVGLSLMTWYDAAVTQVWLAKYVTTGL